MSVRVCRPKLLKNLRLSLVSGAPHFFFRATPLHLMRLFVRPRLQFFYRATLCQRGIRCRRVLFDPGANALAPPPIE